MIDTRHIGFIELFAGIGGVTQGLEQQGAFSAIALTDIDEDSRDTYVENFSDACYIGPSVAMEQKVGLRNR